MIAITIKSGRVELTDVRRPQLKSSTDAIVMVTTTAVGHWDIESARSGDARFAPGAQFAGVIIETGEQVTQVKIDDLVVAMAAAPGGTRFGSSSLPGGHAEYVRVPRADEMLFPTTAAAEERSVFAGGEAALGIRAANSAMENALGDPIAVLGCDTAGLTAIAWLKHQQGRESHVLAVDPNPARCAAAKSLGADPVDFEKLSSNQIAVVIKGLTVESAPPGLHTIDVSPESAGWPGRDEVRRAEMAIRLRQIDLTPVVSTVLPLDEAADAYRIAIDQPPGTRGVLLKP